MLHKIYFIARCRCATFSPVLYQLSTTCSTRQQQQQQQAPAPGASVIDIDVNPFEDSLL
jgi:hypothetical protein